MSIKLFIEAVVKFLLGVFIVGLLIFLPAGSLYAVIPFIAYPFIIAKRIINEEKLLEAELMGYREYKAKVKYRLFPFIW